MTSAWTSPEWTSSATDWINNQLDGLGMELSAPIDQVHVRPWSTVLKIPTRHTDLYFKATSNELRHEAVLTSELGRLFPERIPDVIALEEKRGWMIQPDGGETLRAVFKSGASLDVWEQILPAYAELQMALVPSVEHLLEKGIPDRNLSAFPALVEKMLSDHEAQMPRQDLRSIPVEGRPKFLQKVTELSDDLSAFAIPSTLDHGDFHDANIFYNPSRALFFDWGDASITHPFFSLRTVFVSIENSFGLDERAPQFQRLAEVYLEPWERYEPRTRLTEVFDLARRLWALSSALRWQLVISAMSPNERDPYAEAIPSLIGETLAANARSDFPS